MDKFNKKIAGGIVVVIIVLAAGIYWWQFGGSFEEEVEVEPPEVETELNLDFLESEMVKKRTRYADFPIEIPKKGRDNPFQPF
jgi:hypothetical protein